MKASCKSSVCLVVLTRNPGRFWPRWCAAVQQQQPAVDVVVVDSCSNDGTDFSNLPPGFGLLRVDPADFRHGGTRNLALEHLPPQTEWVVFMTQDALLADDAAIERLLAAFEDPDVCCAYGRQLPHTDASAFAAHARLFGYPAVSYTVGLEARERMGLRACFLSNSFAAYRLADLRALGGFPPDVILGEDMAVAARALLAGKRVAYVADACVYHSHNYSAWQEFQRYFDTGVFHAREPWLLRAFGGAQGEGLRFVLSELRYLLRHAPWRLPQALWRTVCKWVGYRLGRLEAQLPVGLKKRLGMHRAYWG